MVASIKVSHQSSHISESELEKSGELISTPCHKISTVKSVVD